MTKKKNIEGIAQLGAWAHYSQITARVFLIIVLSIVLLCGPAYFLDRALGSLPIATGIAFIFSLPLSQYMIVRSMREYVKNNPQA